MSDSKTRDYHAKQIAEEAARRLDAMADSKTATERLREMLDERGVEYETVDGWWTSWDTEGASSIGGVVYCEDLGSGLEIRWHTITPEQAIATTLGSGTLTAEQVMAIAGKHQPDYCSDTHVCFDWQAIADELNAKLGSGTCKLEETESYSSERGTVHVLECSNCGRECEHINGSYDHCPHCLARAVER